MQLQQSIDALRKDNVMMAKLLAETVQVISLHFEA